jgi:hypothetical protein
MMMMIHREACLGLSLLVSDHVSVTCFMSIPIWIGIASLCLPQPSERYNRYRQFLRRMALAGKEDTQKIQLRNHDCILPVSCFMFHFAQIEQHPLPFSSLQRGGTVAKKSKRAAFRCRIHFQRSYVAVRRHSCLIFLS